MESTTRSATQKRYTEKLKLDGYKHVTIKLSSEQQEAILKATKKETIYQALNHLVHHVTKSTTR
jgi:phosphoribosyl-ATP pyrophosphohydrolase